MKVDAVIPTFNRRELALRAVRSVLAQDHDEVRVVLVDDGSTDGTADAVARLPRDRVTCVRQENQERGHARNAGAAVGTGELLAFLDADDEWTPDHLRRAVAMLEAHPDIDGILGDAVILDERGRRIAAIGRGPGALSVDDVVLNREPACPSRWVLRRRTFERAGGFVEDPALAGSEDWELLVRLSAAGALMRSGVTTVRIHRHRGNTMSDAERMHRSMRASRDIVFGRGAGALPARIKDMEGRCRAGVHLASAINFRMVHDGGRARRELVAAALCSAEVLLDWRFYATLLRSLGSLEA